MRVRRVSGQPRGVVSFTFHSRFSTKATQSPVWAGIPQRRSISSSETSKKIPEHSLGERRNGPQNATPIIAHHRYVGRGKSRDVSIRLGRDDSSSSSWPGLSGFRIPRPTGSPTPCTVESTLLFDRRNRNGLPSFASFPSVERRKVTAAPAGRVGLIGCRWFESSKEWQIRVMLCRVRIADPTK